MSALEGEQLEAFRDRVEEDFRRAEEDFRRAEENYRLDVAAIEHLQRRFFGAVSSIPIRGYSESTKGSNDESVTPPRSAPAGTQDDGLDGSLRAIFHTSLK